MNLETTIANKKNYRSEILFLLVSLFAGILVNRFLTVRIYIPSESMIPTLLVGDRVIATRVYNPTNLKRGDFIGFYSKECDENLLKRLIGLPGDQIKITRKGEVFINGSKLNEGYVKYQDTFSGEFRVPEGKYFFLGDNRLESNDSRMWKNPYIDGKDILGKARLIVYPLNRIRIIGIKKEEF